MESPNIDITLTIRSGTLSPAQMAQIQLRAAERQITSDQFVVDAILEKLAESAKPVRRKRAFRRKPCTRKEATAA